MFHDTPFLWIFLALNVLFLLGTAIWFRVDHATSPRRLEGLLQDSLMEEVMWQYSLRSNLILFGCILALYLLHLGETTFLLGVFCRFALLNVVTDYIYRYPAAALYATVQKGHQMAAIVIWLVAILYWSVGGKQGGEQEY